MTERVDNTKAMAMWGRGFLTLIVVAVWIFIQIALSMALVASLGFGCVNPSTRLWLAALVLLLSALFSFALRDIAESILFGPEKAEEPK